MYIFYELLGFAGFGPGRLEIRYGGLAVFRQWLPWLVSYGILQAFLLASGCRQLTRDYRLRTLTVWLVAFALVLGFILVVGFKVQFRVLGRHCAPLLPLIIFVQGLGLAVWLNRGKSAWRLLAVIFLGTCLVSAASVRFGERHAKDDYREAAALGREALSQGQRVWWSAEIQGAWVYRMAVTTQMTNTQAAFYIFNPELASLKALPKPDLVLLSKADLYDRHGAVQTFLKQNNYRLAQQLSAFTVWRRQ